MKKKTRKTAASIDPLRPSHEPAHALPDPAHEPPDPGDSLFDPAHALPDPSHAPLSPDHRKALTRFLAQIREAGLPEPELYANDGRVEMLWREQKLVVQIDDIIEGAATTDE